jgi:hypothetical protein
LGSTAPWSGDGFVTGPAGRLAAQGLALSGFADAFDFTQGLGGNLLAANYIGLDPDDTLGHGTSGAGVRIGTPNNTIGGPSGFDRNVISGNGQAGLLLEGDDTANNAILGNYVGTDPAGTSAISNGLSAAFPGILRRNRGARQHDRRRPTTSPACPMGRRSPRSSPWATEVTTRSTRAGCLSRPSWTALPGGGDHDQLDFTFFGGPIAIDLRASGTQVVHPDLLTLTLVGPEQFEDIADTPYDVMFGNSGANDLIRTRRPSGPPTGTAPRRSRRPSASSWPRCRPGSTPAAMRRSHRPTSPATPRSSAPAPMLPGRPPPATAIPPRCMP